MGAGQRAGPFSLVESSEDPSDDAGPSTDTKNAAGDEEFDAASMPATESVSDDKADGLPNPADALNHLIEDPRYRSDQEYADYVMRQFGRVYGTDGETDATGRLIVDGELDRAKEDLPGLEKVRKPDQLTVGQRAAICPYYFDDVLRTVGGRKALDEIGNDEAAAAFADTLFRFGRSRGTEIIQDAMNRVFRENGYPEMLKDRQMGQGTLAAYSYLATDDGLAKRLSYYLFGRRVEHLKNQRNDERDRSGYFAFPRINPK